jgi:hypothetical protein
MFRETKRIVICGLLGRPVEIVELYQIEGTRTCQVEVNPFYWHCRESRHCGAQVCDLQQEYFLLKDSIKEE